MTSATLLPRRAKSASTTTFSVAAIHDGLADCFRAKEALESLKHVLAPQIQVWSKLWSYQQLMRLDIRAMALRAAADADMIIIAASARAALPHLIERWLDSCLAEHRAIRPILVALADDENSATSRHGGEFRQSVRQLASRWHADFMSGTEMDKDVDASFVQQRARSARTSSFELPWLEFGTCTRLYGIND